MNISNLPEEQTFIYQTLDSFKIRLDELLSPLMQRVALFAIAIFFSIAARAIYHCCFSVRKKGEDKIAGIQPETVNGVSTAVSRKAVVFSDGETWEGELKDHLLKGPVTIKSPDGQILKGTFKSGVLQGKVKITYSNGDSWTGEADNKDVVLSHPLQSASTPFKINTLASIVERSFSPLSDSPVPVTPIHSSKAKVSVKSHPQKAISLFGSSSHCEDTGTHKVINEDGDVFEGLFVDGLLECPDGTITFKDGTIHRGPFKKNLLNGWGKIIDKNGDRYTGFYVDGKLQGQGVIVLHDEKRLMAHFKNGVIQGEASSVSPKKVANFQSSLFSQNK